MIERISNYNGFEHPYPEEYNLKNDCHPSRITTFLNSNIMHIKNHF